MPNNDVTVEGLQIVITQESTKAVKGIERLAEALQGLKSVTTGGLKGLTTMSRQLERFNTAFSAMSDLSKLEQLRDVLAQIKGIGNIDISAIARSSGSINTEALDNIIADSKVTKAVESSYPSESGYPSVAEEFRKAAKAAEVAIEDISKPLDRLMKQIELQSIRVNELGKEYAKLKTANSGEDDEQTAAVGLAWTRAKDQLERYKEKLREVQQTYKYYAGAAESTVNQISDPIARMRMQIDLQTQSVNNLAMKYEQLKAVKGAADPGTITAGTQLINAQSQLERYKEKLIEIAIEAGYTKEQIKELADEMGATSGSADEGTGSFSKLFASFKRIATYRAIRAVLKAITQGFTEGLQNLAKYSASANKALSELKTVSTYMGNSLAAAVMPVIETLTPVLVGLGQAVVYVFNCFNALFSLMSGKTSMTVAVSQWEDYTESVNEAKKAVTGFDELNKLGDSSDTSATMFTTETIDLGDITGALTTIAGLGAGITAVMALLKDGSFLKNWKSLGGSLMIIAGVLGTIVSYVSIINDGASWSNTITLIGSLALAVGGLALKFGNVGTKIGLVIAAIALLVAAIVDMVNNGITIQNVTLVVAALTAAVIACGLQFGAVGASIALIIGNIITLVLGVIKYIQEWGSMSLWQKIVAGILLVASAACAVWAVAEAIKGNYIMAAAAAAIGIAVAVGGVAVIDCFAEGGFPDTGELFIANEAGAEMVGSIGGHTAVANNDQIVEAIKRGVYEAMQSSATGGDWTIQVVDSKGRVTGQQIVSAVQRKNIRDGKTVIQLG